MNWTMEHQYIIIIIIIIIIITTTHPKLREKLKPIQSLVWFL
jgi:hypothetical protein